MPEFECEQGDFASVEQAVMTLPLDLKSGVQMGSFQEQLRLQFQASAGGRRDLSPDEWKQQFDSSMLKLTEKNELVLLIPIVADTQGVLPLEPEPSRRGRRRGLNAAHRRQDEVAAQTVRDFVQRTRLSKEAIAKLADLVNTSEHIQNDLRSFSVSFGVDVDILLRFLNSEIEPFEVSVAETRTCFQRHLLRAIAPDGAVRDGLVKPVDRLIEVVDLHAVCEGAADGAELSKRAPRKKGEPFVLITSNLRLAMLVGAAAVLRLPMHAAWRRAIAMKGGRGKANVLSSIDNLDELGKLVSDVALGKAASNERVEPTQPPLFD